jgi:hypothetical protein
VPDAVPVESGLAANVKALEAGFQCPKAGVKIERGVRPSQDAPRQAFKPPGANIVNSQVSRNAQRDEFL